METLKNAGVALLVAVAAVLGGACDLDYEEEKQEDGFPPCQAEVSGDKIHVRIPAATVGKVTTNAGEAHFNTYGNAFVSFDDDTDEIRIDIDNMGNKSHKVIKKSQLS